MRILLTAFEPFGGESTNAALEVVTRVRAPEKVLLNTLTVPTVFGLCTETVLFAMRALKPDVVLCVGQAAGRAAITPERIAINVRDARIPDNAGRQPIDEPIDPRGPAAYFSTLPIRKMTEAIRSAGIPAAISNSAGTFVCNDLFYGVCHAIATEFPSAIGGFVHVPCTPAQAEVHTPPLASMEPDKIVAGLEAAIGAILE